ncbi:MAG: DUF4810 domain-containing protein [Gammaproteobacteria bacterium]|nr:DUF4810 domain-containing protein [Gammaproteobacteria bacterium]MBT6835948.1 DUF4810 domain-containing protein [Bacteroidota bacterium]
MKTTIIIILSLFLFSGCAARISQSNLYWGNYSHTLYNVKKEPGEKSNKAHQEELLSIIDKSTANNLRVPPGIYAELGVLAKERGDNNAASNYFRLEQNTYSEGSVLMKRAISNNPSDS